MVGKHAYILKDLETRLNAIEERNKAFEPLLNEYRPSMDKDVLHSWAQDIIAVIKKES